MALKPLSIDELARASDELRGLDHRARSIDEIKILLDKIVSGHWVCSVPVHPQQTLFRVRKCDSSNPYNSLRDLIYPPVANVSYGRANVPGKPVLYASWNLQTALDEINAEAGDHVQVIEVRLRAAHEVILLIIGEMRHIYSTGRSLLGATSNEAYASQLFTSNNEQFVRAYFVDCLFAELFSRPGGRSIDYKITSFIAENLLSRDLGLIYPSVQAHNGINIALPKSVFDSRCLVASTTLIKIEKFYKYGIYQLRNIALSSQFGLDGTIIWSDATGSLPSSLSQSDPNRAANGWVVPA